MADKELKDTDAFFDLQKKMTTDTEFAGKATNLLQTIRRMDIENRPKERDAAILKLLRGCHYNPSLLVPMFFPDFSMKKPMTLWSRPHAVAMMSIAPNASITIQSSRQIGKCLVGTTKLHCKIDGNEEVMSIEDLFDSI